MGDGKHFQKNGGLLFVPMRSKFIIHLKEQICCHFKQGFRLKTGYHNLQTAFYCKDGKPQKYNLHRNIVFYMQLLPSWTLQVWVWVWTLNRFEIIRLNPNWTDPNGEQTAWGSSNYCNEQPLREEWQYTQATVCVWCQKPHLSVVVVMKAILSDLRASSLSDPQQSVEGHLRQDYTTYNLDWNQTDLERPSRRRRRHDWLLKPHAHVISADIWPTQRLPQTWVCVFL